MRTPEESAQLLEELMKERGIVGIEYGPGFGAKGNAWHVTIEQDGRRAETVSDYSLAKALAMVDRYIFVDWE